MPTATRRLAAVLLVVGCGTGAGAANADPPTPSPAPSPVTTIDRDGTFAVGIDIVPGTYSSAGPVENQTCYWKRISSTGDIIDNALTKKSQIVNIDASDASFKSSGCQPWSITDAAPPVPVPPAIAGLQLGGL